MPSDEGRHRAPAPGGERGNTEGAGMRERIRRRMFPLIASAGLILVGMSTSTWGSTLIGRAPP